MQVHIDSDIGGDTDDLCALAMVLAWPDAEIRAVTTVGDTAGRRAGYARYALDMAGRRDTPVYAGADTARGYFAYELTLPSERRYWPEPITRLPGPQDAALDALADSIRAGATIIAIGPLTNLALLERREPGTLEQARLVIMGGYLHPIRPGFPEWENEYDFNLQVDAASALTVLQASHPTLVPLTVTVETALRWADLPALRAAGPLARLLARQAEEFAADEGLGERFGRPYAGLPDDLINFQHDALACAVALGWDGVDFEDVHVAVDIEGGELRERLDRSGRAMRVVTSVDAGRFAEDWLRTVTAAAG